MDGRYLVAAASVLEKLAGDRGMAAVVARFGLHAGVIELLRLSLSAERDIR